MSGLLLVACRIPYTDYRCIKTSRILVGFQVAQKLRHGVGRGGRILLLLLFRVDLMLKHSVVGCQAIGIHLGNGRGHGLLVERSLSAAVLVPVKPVEAAPGILLTVVPAAPVVAPVRPSRAASLPRFQALFSLLS